MFDMFCYCDNIESLDLSGWDVSNVHNMNYMFYHCYNLKSLDLSGWDASKVEYIDRMFDECPAPYKVIDNKIVKK